ncbi:MAG TPA: hypothetical protein VGE76_20880 [Opitutaceae bacterium]
MKFPAFLTALAGRPKNFEAATGTLAEAKTFADSVQALFTAAGLNLEQMLAAGPDALKAHLTGLDHTAEVTRLTGELATAKTEIGALTTERDTFSGRCTAFGEAFATLGIADPAKLDGVAFKSAFAGHVQKQVTLEVAKLGLPAAPNAPKIEVAQTDAELAAEYEKLPRGSAKIEFFSKHEAALRREEKRRRTAA